MDFAFTEEQQALFNELSRFARKELRDKLRQAGREGRFPTELWQQCGALDLFGLVAPPAYGGAGHDALGCATALEALGYGAEHNGFLFSVGVQILAGTVPVAMFGSEAQKERFLRPMVAGTTTSAFCASEPGAGSDLLGLKTRAETRGDQVALTGSKTFITNAPQANLLIVLARDAEAASALPVKQLSVYLVERERPGVSVGPPFAKLGLELSPMAEVFLEECAVPLENRLGPAGAGYTIFNTVMQWERVLLPAIYLGVMRAQLERTTAYARQRKQFNQALTEFQAVSHALAEMKARLEASRLLVFQAAWLMSKKRQAALEGSVAKLFASESFQKNSQQALQLHGSYGYMKDLPLEQELRDAVAATLYSGTSEVHKTIIARLIPCPPNR